MVWADDKIVPAEATAMKEFISLAPISEEEQKTALGWLKNKVELDVSDFEDLRPDARANLYRSAARIAAIDKDVAEMELVFLRSLRALLAIDDETAERIEEEILGNYISAESTTEPAGKPAGEPSAE